ncbi:MAG: Na+/H+ antiporter NhaA [Acidimicrobiales bacterium]|jgi:NhaA family Na+:H+ antiporter|nr:Na+/H+ antiporter NhaA [Acidimicrobiales bacterium]
MSEHDPVEDHDHHWRLTWLGSDRLLARGVARPLARFLRIEAASGVLLILATALALVWANAATGSYDHVWETPVLVEVGSFSLDLTAREWVNDGLMALFFFIAGLEIKRELVQGELRDRRAAALPVLAALGGMVVPAVIYTAFNAGGVGAQGWGIPMATDIAFAVGIVSLLGSRVPVQLKIFLLTLAVADDLGAIAVIAVFYNHGIDVGWLAVAALLFAGVVVAQRARIRWVPLYVLLGVGAWYCMLESGVHATVAGVVMGFLTPITALRDRVRPEDLGIHDPDQPLDATGVRVAIFHLRESVSVGERLVDSMLPWTSYVIIPLFALGNAGIVFGGGSGVTAITLGVFFGLVVGKTVGVCGAAYLAAALRLAKLPRGVTFTHMLGISMAAGIGFTVALFVAGLSFDDLALQDQAKLGIFAASFVAAVLSAIVLWYASTRVSPAEAAREEEENEEFFAEVDDDEGDRTDDLDESDGVLAGA